MASLKDDINQFYRMNSSKIKFFLAGSSILFSSGAIIILIITFAAGAPFNLSLAVKVLLSAGIGLPLIIFLLGAWDWLYRLKLYNRALSVHPFNELEKIGFRTVKVNQGSRWRYTEEIKAGVIASFEFHCYVEKERKNEVIFWTDTIQRNATMKSLSKAEKLLEEQGFESNRGGYLKKYSINAPPPSLLQITRELERLSELLLAQGYFAVHHEDVHIQLSQQTATE